MDFPAFVLDTSAAMALVLQDEEGARIEKEIDDLLSGNGQIFVPSLFWYEVGNTLTTAFRMQRISLEQLRGIEADISELPISTDSLPDLAVRMRIREIAVNRGLTYYDASYIELAGRYRVRLLSFDEKLLDAAGK